MKTAPYCALAFAVLSGAVPASAHAADAPSTRTFAIIVANNRSTKLARPDLRYADDDGAKYLALFRMLAPAEDVALLAHLDRDTATLFPEAASAARPPTRGELAVAIDRVAKQVGAAKEKGPVDVYFVFAGHGDVEEGKGFLELEDGVFGSEDLDAFVRRVPATRIHVVLDSCNSFFVVNARKAGGRRFVTTDEAAKSLAARWSNVGVFLSTSANGEVFEWSELQSGIFSHAVRSGAFGAADANGDGVISYGELRAFVGIATRSVINPTYRPQVFARGPGGAEDAPLFDLRRAEGARFSTNGTSSRSTVVDRHEVPWIDMHREAGYRPVVVLPKSLAGPTEVRDLSDDGARETGRSRLDERPAGKVELVAENDSNPAIAGRGADAMFRSLFRAPFGPAAMRAFEADKENVEPPAFGVSDDDLTRLNELLWQTADEHRKGRLFGGGMLIATGALVGGAAAVALLSSDHQNTQPVYYSNGTVGTTQDTTNLKPLGWALAATGAGVALAGGIVLAIPSPEEKLYNHFRTDKDKDSLRRALDAESELLRLAQSDKTQREIGRWSLIGLGALAAGAGGVGFAISSSNQDRTLPTLGLIEGGVFLGLGIFLPDIPTTTEKMAQIWSRDPSVMRFHRESGGLTVKPQIGLGFTGFTGTF